MQPTITWKSCSDLPIEISEAKTTVIGGKVYCGGGVTNKAFNDDFHVYCYDISQDTWSVLPQLPVRFFGVGRINGTVVAVGGTKMGVKGMKQNISDGVYSYNEQLQQWEQTIPPMPTGRHSPGVLSLESALIVVSGYTANQELANSVEIFMRSTSQWCRTDPLPFCCCDVSMVANGSRLYVLGGFQDPVCLNQAIYASVDDLFQNAVPANLVAHTDSDDSNHNAWKLLPDTPIYRPAAAMMAGCLLGVGGSGTSQGAADRKEIYAYSPSIESWIYISNLPAPLREISISHLSPMEILVIGGQRNDLKMKTVYKGTLNLKL